MNEGKPPFGRALAAGVVAVASFLPWTSGWSRAIAWEIRIEVGGLEFPAWIVVPLAAFSAVIAWGRHRDWHDLPRGLPLTLDVLGAAVTVTTMLAVRPNFGAVLALFGISLMAIVEVAEMATTARAHAPSDDQDRLRRLRRKRRFPDRIRTARERGAFATPTFPSAADDGTPDA